MRRDWGSPSNRPHPDAAPVLTSEALQALTPPAAFVAGSHVDVDMVSLPESTYTLTSRAVLHMENVLSQRMTAAMQGQMAQMEAMFSTRLAAEAASREQAEARV